MDAIHWVVHHGALDEEDFYDSGEPVMVTAYVEEISKNVIIEKESELWCLFTYAFYGIA